MSRYVKNFQVSGFLGGIKQNRSLKRAVVFLERKPLTSFFVALAVLFLLILVGNILANRNNKPEEKPVLVKSVSVYSLGKTPSITLQGKVEKSGIVKLVAQTTGVVQTINAEPGDRVGKGETVISLSSNYQGGDALSLQQQLAQTQYNNTVATYDAQKDIIGKQRDLANKTDSNNDELRDISGKSIDETNSLISVNDDILSTLNTNLTNLENTNVNGSNDATILQTKQAISGVEGGLNQLRASVRNIEYQTNTDKPPTQLSDVQKDLTMRQLDVQEKALDMNKEVSRLQLGLASVNAGLMRPASPYAATVDRVYVHVGDVVNPGTVLAILSCPQQAAKVIVTAPREITQAISRTEVSQLQTVNEKFSLSPSFISQSATDGQLYSVEYQMPQDSTKQITDSEFISVTIPLTYETVEAKPYVPIDAVYQSQDQAYVFVVDKNVAKIRNITLGQVYGSYAELVSGLQSGDKVILDRNVLAGDKVKVL